ncbi:uncharacterized protein LOC114732978 [Neltuma alba]|uniref:uncharacterized protein LOC114732978 n=1 Tax=Neltuma alba TaxID=207710 RepID=UPI0010A59FEB|nr:uncharacterized protein LOC114732978 [Prosopis alba]
MNNNNDNFHRPEEDDHDDYSDDFLALSLGLRRLSRRRRRPPSSEPQTMPQIPVYVERMQSVYYRNPVIQLPSDHPLYIVPPEVLAARSPSPPRMHLNSEPPLGRGRVRRNPSRNNGEDNNRTIPPPYPWATNRPAVVHDLRHLVSDLQIETITGMVRCNRCDKDYEIGLNLEQKLNQFWSFVASKRGTMHDRAPEEWSSPPSMTCRYCSGDGVKPIIDENKDKINWLFLFLGQILGYCTLDQLKYFCGCTRNHRTGAKDRVLYLSYREIFRQLLPEWPEVSW